MCRADDLHSSLNGRAGDKVAVCSDTSIRLTTSSFANEITFDLDSEFKFGDISRKCQSGAANCPSMGCTDNNSHCDPFVSYVETQIPIHIAPGAHQIHAFDSAGDGWGTGARIDIVQRRYVGTVLQWVVVATTGEVHGSSQTLNFHLSCAVSDNPPVNQSVCTAVIGVNTWGSSCLSKSITCSAPANNVTTCPNVTDCVFTPGATGAQGSCGLSSQSLCTAALYADTTGAECQSLKCTYHIPKFLHVLAIGCDSPYTKVPKTYLDSPALLGMQISPRSPERATVRT